MTTRTSSGSDVPIVTPLEPRTSDELPFGSDEFIQKPFSAHTLLAGVRRLLEDAAETPADDTPQHG